MNINQVINFLQAQVEQHHVGEREFKIRLRFMGEDRYLEAENLYMSFPVSGAPNVSVSCRADGLKNEVLVALNKKINDLVTGEMYRGFTYE